MGVHSLRIVLCVVRLNDLAELTVQTDGQMQSAKAAQLLLSKRIDDLLHRFS